MTFQTILNKNHDIPNNLKTRLMTFQQRKNKNHDIPNNLKQEL